MTRLERLERIKDSLVQSLDDETLYQAANSPRPDYSLDGESYQWAAWREAVLRKVEAINRLIQQEKPFFISSRGKP